MQKVKVLFLASNPLQQSRLALDEEVRTITAQIRSAEHRDAIELISAWAVRRDDLQQLLLQHKPHILHFSGHGTRCTPIEVAPPSTPTSGRDMVASGKGQVAQLVLMGEGGQAQPMSEAALIHLLGVLKDNLKLVVLSACHSEPIAEALAEVIPYAIGMSGAIPDEAAIAFTAAFYRGLGFGRNLQEAFDLGKNALINLQVPEDQRPGLYCRKGAVDPAKVVLVGPSSVPSRARATSADRNRVAMLEKVRTIWITGFLQQSLFHETRVLLGLSERPEAVARPMDLLVKRPDQGERPLPPGTQIVQVFDAMDQALLILGAPGSGKTTLLLELARDLLTRADDDPAQPIPVVFPLATWSESRKPLVGWLRDELNFRYDVPRAIAQEWVASDQVLPLLDGLDEVKAEHRAACVEAINAFRQSRGLLPLVITSRTADYEALAKPLRLHGAILVRPLTRDQVNAYLTDLGPAGEPVRAAIRDDPSLWDLLDSPLLLNIITVSYAGRTTASAPISGTLAERRDRLFALYVYQMLRRRAAERRYTPEQTVQWLSWLADQMANHGQTVFYLEQLQLDWLPHSQCPVARLCGRLIFGLVFGLVFGTFGALFGGLDVGLLFVLIFVLLSALGSSSEEVVCVEAVRWSWSESRHYMSSIPVSGVVSGLIGGLVSLLTGMMMFGVLVGVLVGLLMIVLLFVLIGGLTFGRIETRAIPNEGIIRSAKNALLFGLVGGLGVGPVFGMCVGLVLGTGLKPSFRLGVGPAFGLAFGLVFGLGMGLRAGGEACLKHVVLRIWLIRNGSTPWNYVRFLDNAAERLLLRKVGGGYAFIHRMLLDYFAAQYVVPSSGGARPAKPSSIKDEWQTA
jgi:hypothetical protein